MLFSPSLRRSFSPRRILRRMAWRRRRSPRPFHLRSRALRYIFAGAGVAVFCLVVLLSNFNLLGS